MAFFNAVYNLFIGPLKLFFEMIFSLANSVLDNPGLSIIFLSLAMNFLVLPLYRKADAMQEEERETEKKLGPWVKHIKKTFSGDERFMMLQTYYRQNNYKPTYVLRGSVSLLLEIPFFIAAYNFLSGLQILNDFSFGPIADMGAPDGLIVLGGLSINLLPILMTAVNIVSSSIYAKDLPARSKVQLYGMAAIFLVLLYDSPAGLVFYWTLNNIFSLLKNLFYKLRNPRLVLCIISAAAAAAMAAFLLFIHPLESSRDQLFLLLFACLLLLPLIFYFADKRHPGRKPVQSGRREAVLFLSGCILMFILTGILIPSAVIKASPEEFINRATYSNPLHYILNSAILAAGTFIVWAGIFYKLASPAGKKLMSLGMWLFSGAAITDYMFFGKNYGNMTPTLAYDCLLEVHFRDQLINLLILLALSALLILIWKKRKQLVQTVYTAAIVALALMSAVNIFSSKGIISDKIAQLKETSQAEQASIPLSTDGKNVIVIMLDRAINPYIPYIFNEKPELREQFSGFTYYPNTMSYGGYTNIGAPPLYGGYEYTPTEMNKRDKELLADKHNEAMRVMPVIFDENGFDVTVCDPTYAGYTWIPDLSIYDDHPDIRKFLTMGTVLNKSEEMAEHLENTLNRNFFCYSMFKISPVVIHPYMYGDSLYFSQGTAVDQVATSPFRAIGTDMVFMQSYSVLDNLNEMTEIKDGGTDTFMMISNDTTHDPILLQEPEYVPSAFVDNTEYEQEHADRFTLNGRQLYFDNQEDYYHYQCNMASMIMLGDWFDYLRENGVYDNTRIIMVSDHGNARGQLEDMKFDDGGGPGTDWDAMAFNPLLMVKDFGSTELTECRDFMTNADVPSLALKGLIENPINPFTGKPVNSDAKTQGDQYILFSYDWDISYNNGTQFMPGDWFTVHDNIFDMNNWVHKGWY